MENEGCFDHDSHLVGWLELGPSGWFAAYLRQRLATVGTLACVKHIALEAVSFYAKACMEKASDYCKISSNLSSNTHSIMIDSLLGRHFFFAFD